MRGAALTGVALVCAGGICAGVRCVAGAGGGGALANASQIIAGLQAVAGDKAMLAVQVFSLFAIITSFLGVAMGCVDFVSDLLRPQMDVASTCAPPQRHPGEKRCSGCCRMWTGLGSSANEPSAARGACGVRRLDDDTEDGANPGFLRSVQTWLDGLPRWAATAVPLALTLGPPLGIASLAPGIFYPALEFSGTFRMVLFGLLPTVMVWFGRYSEAQELPWLPGGAATLLCIGLVSVGVIGVEWGHKLGLFEFIRRVMEAVAAVRAGTA